MVSVDKFFVFGGGRWREVDTSSGRIDGWGKAKFLVARGGKLQATRARPVLAALRSLADKKPSAAREGQQVPSAYSTQRRGSPERGREGCAHCQCCHHSNAGSSCASKPTEKKASIAIQCGKAEPAAGAAPDQAQQKLPPLPSKRKRSTSSEDLFHTKVTAVASVQSPSDTKRRRTSLNSPKKIGSNNSGGRSTSSEESKELATLKKSVKSPSLKVRRPGPLKRKRSFSKETSPALKFKSDETQRQNKLSRYLQPKSKRFRKDSSSSPAPHLTSILISSDESDFETNSKSHRQKKSMRIRSVSSEINKPGLKDTRRASTDKPFERVKSSKNYTNKDASTKHKMGPKKIPDRCDELAEHETSPRKTKSKPQSKKQSSDEKGFQVRSYQQDTSKELLIEERDVEILRLFLQKHYPDEELLKFDTDDDYKKLHFFQINPLVNVERCPRIARMIQAQKSSEISLVAFASKLGLRSVSEASSIQLKRCRTLNSHSEESGAEDKENIDRPLSNTRLTKIVPKESLKRNKPSARERDGAVELSGQSGMERAARGFTPEARKPLGKTKPKAITSSKRPALKEYSNLEDHAIVSWVSVGARASCVNGNRLWRQLQEQFQRLTGNGRTWHSLRNRYLRYILPRLAALALPPAHQARLRAAAATGELKARRKELRRNSIFALPARGASSRRPNAPPPRGDSSEGDAFAESKKPAERNARKNNAAAPPPSRRDPSPRYSDVTRQFARSHRSGARRSPRKAADKGPERSGGVNAASESSEDSPARLASGSSGSSGSTGSSGSSGSTGSSGSSGSTGSSGSDERTSLSSDRSGRRKPPSAVRARASRRRSDGRHSLAGSSGPASQTKSNKRNVNGITSSNESNGRMSSGRMSPSRSKRSASPKVNERKNRSYSPRKANGRKSEGTGPPSATDGRDESRRASSPVDSNRRKSDRLKAPERSQRRTPAEKAGAGAGSGQQRPARTRTRKLYNPRAVM